MRSRFQPSAPRVPYTSNAIWLSGPTIVRLASNVPRAPEANSHSIPA